MRKFVVTAKAIYGEKFISYNVHSLLHLHEDFRHKKRSLEQLSAFKFDNALRRLKRVVKNNNNPLKTMYRCFDSKIPSPTVSL